MDTFPPFLEVEFYFFMYIIDFMKRKKVSASNIPDENDPPQNLEGSLHQSFRQNTGVSTRHNSTNLNGIKTAHNNFLSLQQK